MFLLGLMQSSQINMNNKEHIDLCLDSKKIGEFKSLIVRHSKYEPWYPIFPVDKYEADFFVPPTGELILTEGSCLFSTIKEGFDLCEPKGEGKMSFDIDLGDPRSRLFLLGDKEILLGTRLTSLVLKKRCGLMFVSSIEMRYRLDEDNDGMFDAIDGLAVKSPGS